MQTGVEAQLGGRPIAPKETGMADLRRFLAKYQRIATPRIVDKMMRSVNEKARRRARAARARRSAAGSTLHRLARRAKTSPKRKGLFSSGGFHHWRSRGLVRRMVPRRRQRKRKASAPAAAWTARREQAEAKDRSVQCRVHPGSHSRAYPQKRLPSPRGSLRSTGLDRSSWQPGASAQKNADE